MVEIGIVSVCGNTMCLVLIMKEGKNVEPNRHLCTMSKLVFLADDKMANISLDLHTFIAQNLPKYIFQSSPDYTFLSLISLSVSLALVGRQFPLRSAMETDVLPVQG